MEGVLAPVKVLGAVMGLDGKKSRVLRVIIVLIVSVSAIWRQILEPVNKNKGLIITSVEFANYNLQVLTAFFCLVLTKRRMRRIEDFYTSVGLLDKKLASMGFPIDYGGTKRLVRTLTAFFIFKTLLQQVPFFLKGTSWTRTDLFDYVVYNVPIIVIHVLLLHWILYLKILDLHFKTLNTILKKIRYGRCYKSEDFRTKRTTTRICSSIYDNLCSLVENVNGTFAPQLLFLIPTFFIMTIFTSFQTCRMIKRLIDFNVGWIIYDVLYFVVFLELVVPCVNVKSESENFVETLHRINDEEINDVINSLILQTYHQKIDFSACGVFPLDGTLIYKVLGALTTYLVILLQFDL